MSDGYPIVLRIRGRRCVVAGGGAVAARKVAPLLAAGAEIVVIAPTVDPAIEQALSEGTLSIERRAFEVSDLDGAFLAIVATDRPDVNRAVRQARSR